MIDGGEQLSEEEAQRVWKRAADLQAAAADHKSRARAPAAEAGRRTGYKLTQVREAAAEAGIAPEFVAAALAEEDEAAAETGWAERLIGPEPRSLVVSRRFDTPIDAVAAALQRVLARHHLTLVDMRGEPLDGGMMTFALPPAGAGAADAIVAELAGARIEELRLRLHRLDDASCVVTLSAPLDAARRANLGTGVVLTASGGIVGGWALGALGAAVLVPLGLGAAATAAAIGGALLAGLGGGGRLGIAASRAAHRSGQRRGTAALERLLQSVGLELRGTLPESSSR